MQTFSFQMTAPDPVRLCPQVSRALERQTELISRRKYPKMWELTDKLNRAEKNPRDVRENRRKRRAFLGLWSWALAVVLLIPGLLMQKGTLILLLTGAACYGCGVTYLWRYSRTLLGVLSLAAGALLCLGALGNPAELGPVLFFGILGAVIGIAALLTRKQSKTTPFDRAARKLLEQRAQEKAEPLQVIFSDAGMTAGRQTGDAESHPLPYSEVTVVLETEDLLLFILDNQILLLQKGDLRSGSLPELRKFLDAKVPYLLV